MSNTAPQNLQLDEFLVVINSRDLVGRYIVPKPDVATKLEQVISKRTGCERRNLAGESGYEKLRSWVSAEPGRFITETRIAVEGVCAKLKGFNAQSFEATFHNTQDSKNWGDRVLFAVRYIRATQDGAMLRKQ